MGMPKGSSKSGTTEILNYPSGLVRLENGRVDRVYFKTAPARRPSSAPLVAAPAPQKSDEPAPKEDSPLADVWLNDIVDAKRDAVRRDTAILALFTASEASPAQRQFQKEIVLHPEFVNAFRGLYVMLNIDVSARRDTGSASREHNDGLREALGIHDYPALVVLSSNGEKIASVDLSDPQPGAAYRARLITAVLAAYELPTRPEVPSAPLVIPALPVTENPPAPTVHVAPPEVTTGLSSARWLITIGLAVGAVIATAMLFVLWLFIRKINKPTAHIRHMSMAARIDQAASGLPSRAELAAWPKDKLCVVAARLAEMEGYMAEEQPKGSDKDLVLKRPGDPTPKIFVWCATGSAGVISVRRVRDLVGTLMAEEVAEGWFIAPLGFSPEARAYADEHNVRTIDGATLLDQLSDVPTFALPKVLAAVR